jgi:type II secretory pathway pseudopilin PulG
MFQDCKFSRSDARNTLNPCNFETLKSAHSNSRRNVRHHEEGGYVLLALLLTMALLVIFAAVAVPSIKFSLQRDREEEMIHRGVQYSRAVRAFYKKFGRYPTKIEDLENTNSIRFLRKRYKDPLRCPQGKCDDFKLLYFNDVQTALSGFGGGNIPGATPVSAMGSTNSSAAPGQNGTSSFGGSSSFGSSFNSSNSSSITGQNQTDTQGQGQGTDPSQTDAQNSDSNGTNPSGDNNSNSGQPGSGQVIGGPIVGVASLSKAKTIREFNHKKQYKDWLFVYDPSQDTGFLIKTPYQPQMMGTGMNSAPNLNGQNGSNGSSSFGSGNGFGSSNGFGNPSGSQNNQNSGFGNSNQQNNPPQQQQ